MERNTTNQKKSGRLQNSGKSANSGSISRHGSRHGRGSGIFVDPLPPSEPGSVLLSPDFERKLWGKSLLKLWGLLYLTLWAFLTLALGAENAFLRSTFFAAVIAFGSSLLITLLFGAPLITIARFRRGAVQPEEKLLAVVFAMLLLVVFPGAWYFGFAWPTTLAITLAGYTGLVLLGRYSRFRQKLLGEDSPRLFPSHTER